MYTPASVSTDAKDAFTLQYTGQVDSFVQANGVGRLWSTNPLFMYEGQFGADG